MLRNVFCRSRFAGLALAVAATAAPARADQIDRVLAEDASGIAGLVRGSGAKNVAVLKFQVQIGDEAPNFRFGTEGVEMVHRMENILILTANPKNPEYIVLTGAGDEASKLAQSSKTSIDWTTAAGRKKLFDLKLPVAWDDSQKLSPDAFLTGTVRVSKDMREVYIDLVIFTKADPANLKKLVTINGPKVNGKVQGIPMDRAMLASLGQTFSTPRNLKPATRSRDLTLPNDAASQDAAKRENNPTDPTVVTPQAGPVKMDVIINGAPVSQVPDESSRGEFKLATKLANSGTAGQPVLFRLTNTGDKRVAALLCVNGRNTIAIDNEDLSVLDKPRSRFRMYVLDPGKTYDIKGFLRDEQGNYGPFELLPEDRSSEEYAKLSPDYRGKIQMFVHAGKDDIQKLQITGTEPTNPAVDPNNPPVDTDPQALMEKASADNGLASTERSLAKSRNFKLAQEKVQEKTRMKMIEGKLYGAKPRPLILEAQNQLPGGKVEIVKFEYDENPADSMVVSYYAPDAIAADKP